MNGQQEDVLVGGGPGQEIRTQENLPHKPSSCGVFKLTYASVRMWTNLRSEPPAQAGQRAHPHQPTPLIGVVQDC